MKFKFKVFLLLTGFVFLMYMGCKKNTEAADPVVTLINYIGCKESLKNSLSQSLDPVKHNDCIEYSYNGKNTLILNHINAGFNCCPGKIISDIEVAGNTITITERETEAGCLCLCLFDLNYVVNNIEPGEYNITVIELYTMEGDEILEFTLNLYASISGSHCVQRNHYPW